MNRSVLILISILVCFSGSLVAQNPVPADTKKDTLVNPSDIHIQPDSSTGCFLITASYAYQFPGGDMAKRFGSNSSVGGGLYYKTKSDFLIGGEAHFIFGGVPKEGNMLDSIKTGKTSDGNVIDANGQFADIKMYERGYDISAKFGKVFPYGNINRNSGIFATGGIGMLQHKIRIESTGNRAPQLSKEYTKGYDRLANGIMFCEDIGFFYMGDKKLFNFYGALEFVQAFTQGRRFNFDTMQLDNSKRTDLFFGIRAGWMIPVRSREPQEYYIN